MCVCVCVCGSDIVVRVLPLVKNGVGFSSSLKMIIMTKTTFNLFKLLLFFANNLWYDSSYFICRCKCTYKVKVRV